MKKLFKLSTIITLTAGLMVLISCSKENNNLPNLTNGVVGKYSGTLTFDGLTDTSPAEADISSVNDYTVFIHCYGESFDTTFMLELFPNEQQMNVCFTDDEFYNHYGHAQSNNHHMMGNSSWTTWSQHMSNEHQENDMHYGSFNLQEHSFEYTFIVMSQDQDDSITFEGILVE